MEPELANNRAGRPEALARASVLSVSALRGRHFLYRKCGFGSLRAPYYEM
jgi:hypothetical protein